MNRKPIRMSNAVGRVALERLEKLHIPRPVFLGWKQIAEFDLGQPADERQTKRVQRGRDWFHEFETIQPFDGFLFKVVFEMEVSLDGAELLDISIVRLKPNLQDE